MNNHKNDSEAKWMGAGMFAAFFASLCCITPIFSLAVGIGGIGSLFSWIEPFRPYLVGITLVLLGLAWFQKLNYNRQSECECEDNSSFWKSTGFLGIVTIIVILMLAFPYYSGAFFSSQNQQVLITSENQVKTVTLDITGMTCSGCEVSVEFAARNVEGVLEVDASYAAGTIRIKFDQQKVRQKDIVEAINRTGFTVAGLTKDQPLSENIQPFFDSNDICPLHGTGNCSGTCQARNSCTIEHLDQIVTETLDEDITVDIINLDDNNDAFKNAFNRNIGHPRFVAILSSVCRWCIDGAKKIKESILDQTKSDDIQLYIVWMDMLKDDSYSSAKKAAKLLDDSRVTHFYTSGKDLGTEVAKQVSDNVGVAWDIYMFYESTVTWENNFPAPTDYIHQLNPTYYEWVEKDYYYTGEDLKQKLAELTSKYKRNI